MNCNSDMPGRVGWEKGHHGPKEQLGKGLETKAGHRPSCPVMGQTP